MPTISDLRSAVDDLHALAAADLRRLWAQVTNASEARQALEDLLPLLARTYGLAAATIAADWYDDLRDEENIDRRFSAIVADVDNQGADVLARWAIGPLLLEEPDWRRAQVLVDGGLQRRIANAARDTITTSAVEDPKARGWQRVAAGGCAFCRMLESRGGVYTEATVDFASHDHCRCHATPAWDDRELPVKPYTPSAQVASDADRARVRAYLAEHHAG